MCLFTQNYDVSKWWFLYKSIGKYICTSVCTKYNLFDKNTYIKRLCNNILSYVWRSLFELILVLFTNLHNSLQSETAYNMAFLIV